MNIRPVELDAGIDTSKKLEMISLVDEGDLTITLVLEENDDERLEI